MATIRIGVGGWTYEPWRDNFYPKGLKHAGELAYAGEHLTAIEVNGTYYGSQKPESFRKWREETPDGFVFTVKGPRFATNRRVLAEAGESIGRFVGGGVTELKEKLGAINWQFLPTKKFDAEDFEAFLALLPKEADGIALRHVVELRHESFRDPAAIALLAKYGVAQVIAESDEHPQIADITAPFVYLRLQRSRAEEPAGYPEAELDAWAERLRTYRDGGLPADLETVTETPPEKRPRDVFAFVISGAKERNPAAAMALIERVK
ncbi:DUF72 domain-containing protein [Prosthecomicrobium pneumaticum]|uniref:Uncharacterized protein YecE (DUF72 family) n=1 Tax=Prosthecomicrobium pneumaticum TaxID=81895 RepID=A0A7W9CWB5_9HYPH|nr:DUF72 domain-containing protein [Prosthecomicrobium pneumaticum]MBB5752746.1 uncharacterized protein YecE (DUF72 family) [Prosthecomicrobium pneumaticum]